MGGIYWLASYPKSGNTWFRIFLANLCDGGQGPVSINGIGETGIASSRMWLDEACGFDIADLAPDEVEDLRPAVYRWSAQQPDTIHCKIHDAYTTTRSGEPLVSREATLGAIYILRNPLDVASSAASHWHVDVDGAIERMGNPGMCLSHRPAGLTPQVRQKLLNWSQHVLSWVDAPGLSLHVMRYEDMLRSPLATFRAAARFLQLPDEPARVERAIRFSAFDELARQEAEDGFREKPQRTKRFFRHGQSGAWRKQLTPQQIDRIVTDHGDVMRRFGYLDAAGNPI